MRPAPTHLAYVTGGCSEYCLSFGEANAGRTILLLPPLFDEMNRTRRMLIEAMRAMEERSVQTLLPDLPGCNDSMADLAKQSLDGWRQAVSDCATQHNATHIASIRGGALLDSAPGLPRWRLAPAKGSLLLKTMLRTRIAADKEAGITITAEQLLASAQSAPLELSGNFLGPEMLTALQTAEPTVGDNLREVALADVDGSPLWLRAEPGDDRTMSAAIAVELDRWSASCGE